MSQHPPAQQQRHPGETGPMEPRPRDEMADYTGRDLLANKKALVSGGDSGIGRAVCAAFAKEGADVAIGYLSEDADAEHTAGLVRNEDRSSLLIRGDVADEQHCTDMVERTAREFGRIDVLVAHAATQQPVSDFAELSTEQLRRTFEVNVFGVFWTLRAAAPYLAPDASIVITGSVNALRGNKSLIDYSASKAAVHNLTYSLAQHYVQESIRVNCVAPGPVWTPLIPSTLSEDRVEGFGGQAPVGRAADPDEIAPSYVFFASNRLSSYYTGEVLAPTGGEIRAG
ncbi:SDR family oxidoreductase [Streptomonospora litoralis]|nr:SDR family oxidoreductase [Streptomonospora litoralis]